MKNRWNSFRMFYSILIIGLCLISISCDDDEKAASLSPDFEASATTVEDDAPVTFTNLSSGSYDTYRWAFPGGTPGNSTDENPVVTYAEPGVYDVALYIESSKNGVEGVETKKKYITVTKRTEIFVEFSADMTTAEQGAPVVFTSDIETIALDGDATLAWTFEGGTPSSSSDAEVTVTYAEAGTYDVTLVATGGGVTETYKMEDYITVTPIVSDFDASSMSVRENQAVTFTNTSTDGATLAWTFTDGTPATSTDEVVEVTFSTAGNYKVSLEATKNGITKTSEKTIEVRGGQEPFGGTPHSVPGLVEGEDFDYGGQGISYNEFDIDYVEQAKNSTYRGATDWGTEVEPAGSASNGYVLAWTRGDEWFEYTVNVGTAGAYDIGLMASAAGGGRSIEVFIDDVSVGQVEVANSGWFAPMSVNTIPGIDIAAGEHVVKVKFLSTAQWVINLDYIEFTAAP